jgi:hypothetical protein
METLSEFESKVQAGDALTRAEAERLLAAPGLMAVGALGEAARKALSADRVTYGRVATLVPGGVVAIGEAGEVRLGGPVSSADEAIARVREARPLAGARPLTGFSLGDLFHLLGGDHLALADLAAALRASGLESIADAPLDRLGDTENLIEVVRAMQHGGLGVWRATVDRAPVADRLALIERAVDLQAATHALRAFAPLPRTDAADAPATGYDDVRTIAASRLMCRAIPRIQVDWPLYGPKLAQVAIAFGADDIDGVSPVDVLELGHRRSPSADVERQIRAAFAVPAERNGRFEVPE